MFFFFICIDRCVMYSVSTRPVTLCASYRACRHVFLKGTTSCTEATGKIGRVDIGKRVCVCTWYYILLPISEIILKLVLTASVCCLLFMRVIILKYSVYWMNIYNKIYLYNFFFVWCLYLKFFHCRKRRNISGEIGSGNGITVAKEDTTCYNGQKTSKLWNCMSFIHLFCIILLRRCRKVEPCFLF